MSDLTVSSKNNILSPDGNSLAVFVDAIDDELKLKDVRGNVKNFSNYWYKSLGKYGSFYDTQTQTALGNDVPTPMLLNTIDLSNGVTIQDGSKIVVDEIGIYNIQFSAQLDRVESSGVVNVDIWFRKNGQNIPYSNSKVTMLGNANKSHLVASWNYMLEINVGDDVQIMWSTPTTNIKIIAEAENLVVPHPAIPSVILTVIKV